MDSLELAKKIVKILDGNGAVDIAAFDVRGKSTISDFTILATGLSSPHLRALVSDVRAKLREENIPSYRHSGEPDSGWIVLDYVDVVIHVFTREAREYYDLDEMWKGAPKI